MVRPARLERATSRFEAWRSIRVSYGREWRLTRLRRGTGEGAPHRRHQGLGAVGLLDEAGQAAALEAAAWLRPRRSPTTAARARPDWIAATPRGSARRRGPGMLRSSSTRPISPRAPGPGARRLVAVGAGEPGDGGPVSSTAAIIVAHAPPRRLPRARGPGRPSPPSAGGTAGGLRSAWPGDSTVNVVPLPRRAVHLQAAPMAAHDALGGGQAQAPARALGA